MMAVDPSLTGIDILVIEDDRDTAELLADGLELFGGSVRHVQNGEHAVEALSARPAHVLLIDLALPGFDGYRTLATIRAIAELAGIPAIAITGFATERDRFRSRTAGFAMHLVKPVELADVAKAVVEVVGAPRR